MVVVVKRGCMDVLGRKRLSSPPHHCSSAPSAMSFTRGQVLFFPQFQHTVGLKDGVGVDTPGRTFTSGLLQRHVRFLIFASSKADRSTIFIYFQLLKQNIETDVFSPVNVCFSVCWKGEGQSGGGGGEKWRGGGLGRRSSIHRSVIRRTKRGRLQKRLKIERQE